MRKNRISMYKARVRGRYMRRRGFVPGRHVKSIKWRRWNTRQWRYMGASPVKH